MGARIVPLRARIGNSGKRLLFSFSRLIAGCGSEGRGLDNPRNLNNPVRGQRNNLSIR